jgi:hypothetical protein
VDAGALTSRKPTIPFDCSLDPFSFFFFDPLSLDFELSHSLDALGCSACSGLATSDDCQREKKDKASGNQTFLAIASGL